MVLERLFAVVDVGVGKVERTARTATDVGAGQALRLVECTQHEGLARAHAVDVDKGKGVVKAYGKGDALGAHISRDLFHALGRSQRGRAALHVLVVQRKRHHVRLCDHALAEHLQ